MCLRDVWFSEIVVLIKNTNYMLIVVISRLFEEVIQLTVKTNR